MYLTWVSNKNFGLLHILVPTLQFTHFYFDLRAWKYVKNLYIKLKCAEQLILLLLNKN